MGLGGGGADDEEGAHADGVGVEVGEGGHGHPFGGAAHVAAHDDRGGGVSVFEEELAGGVDLPKALLRSRVVDRDDHVGFGGGADPGGDDLPGLEDVRQRNDAEVVAE